MSNAIAFVPQMDTALPIETGVDGFPVAVVGEEQYPVVDEIFEIEIIQPGHLQNADRKEELKPHVGRFYSAAMEESFEELRLLPVQVMTKGRSLFPPFDEGSKELLCYSLNGEAPAPKMESPIAPKCGEFKESSKGEYFVPACPKAQWNGDKKPDCSDWILVAFFDLDRKIPVMINFRGTAISAWNKFRRSYRQKRNAARIKGQSILDYAIRAKLDNSGTYYQLLLEFFYAKDENPAQYGPLLAHYKESLVEPEVQRMEERLAEQSAPLDTVDYEAAADAIDADAADAPEDTGENFQV